jgi:hypothetical protein
LKKFWWLLSKPSILFLYELAIMLLGIYRKDLKTYIHKKTAHECV